MREILFRGKRLDNGEWVGGNFYESQISGCYIVENKLLATVGGRHSRATIRDKLIPYEVDPETVGQYTGKVVKTGKVFDGDIGKSIDGIFLVCWDDEKAAFVMRFNEYPYETLYLEEMWDDAEIIGNIHDNPELLEVRDGKAGKKPC